MTMPETDRPHRALEEAINSAYEEWCHPRMTRIEPDHPGDAFEAGYLAALAALAPEQRGDAEPETDCPQWMRNAAARTKAHMEQDRPHRALDQWAISVRDTILYPLAHESGLLALKAEGLGQELPALLAAPPQQGERQPCPHCNEISDLAASLVGQACERHMEAIRAMSPAEFHAAAPKTCHWCDRERLAAPTPDREALRARVRELYVEGFRAGYEQAAEMIEDDGEHGSIWRNRHAMAVEAGKFFDEHADAPDWPVLARALAALPGGREQERLYCPFSPCDFWCYADTAPHFESCPKCRGSYSFAHPRPRAAAPQASADTGERAP
jgi:hypothetical protein